MRRSGRWGVVEHQTASGRSAHCEGPKSARLCFLCNSPSLHSPVSFPELLHNQYTVKWTRLVWPKCVCVFWTVNVRARVCVSPKANIIIWAAALVTASYQLSLEVALCSQGWTQRCWRSRPYTFQHASWVSAGRGLLAVSLHSSRLIKVRERHKQWVKLGHLDFTDGPCCQAYFPN